MKRRYFLAALAGAGLGYVAWRYWPEDGFTNPCLAESLPTALAQHPLILAAWQDIEASQLWDTHIHLIGNGDDDSGIWINPDLSSAAHPLQWLQRYFYFNASCVKTGTGVDNAYVERLLQLKHAFPAGSKLMLLAFDYYYDSRGQRNTQASSFYTPNEYAQRIAREHSDDFVWTASVHPYRKDAVDALEKAVAGGARAVKWLPAAQGMDPASPQCDAFYQAMAAHRLPLLVHAGAELAVKGGNTDDYGNPLRLRRPLDQGVPVLVAHCASLGSGIDLDRGANADRLPCFELFSRLMEEPAYQGLLFGEISAVTQINRSHNGLRTLLTREDWQTRLVNGSDYPLPGILPLFSLKQLVRMELLGTDTAALLTEVRRYNPLLFDFVLKRSLRAEGHAFDRRVFESRRVFHA